MLSFFIFIGYNIVSRHQFLMNTIGTRAEENSSYSRVINLMAIFTAGVVMCSLLEMVFYFLFNMMVSIYLIIIKLIYCDLFFSSILQNWLFRNQKKYWTLKMVNLKTLMCCLFLGLLFKDQNEKEETEVPSDNKKRLKENLKEKKKFWISICSIACIILLIVITQAIYFGLNHKLVSTGNYYQSILSIFLNSIVCRNEEHHQKKYSR